jgi:hypothetical protein
MLEETSHVVLPASTAESTTRPRVHKRARSLQEADMTYIDMLAESCPDAPGIRGSMLPVAIKPLTVTLVQGKQTFIVPRNYKDEFLSNSSVFKGLIKIMKINKVLFAVADIDQAKSELWDNMRICTFVAGCAHAFTCECSPYYEGDGYFARGVRYVQMIAINDHMDNTSHLRMSKDSPFKVLVGKENPWLAKNRQLLTEVDQLIRMFATKLPIGSQMQTWLRSRGDLESKVILKDLPWNNKGIFRSCEISYMNTRFHNAIESLDNLKANFRNPNHHFAMEFWTHYSDVIKLFDAPKKICQRTIIMRQAHLFPVGRKRPKRGISLEDKILGLQENTYVRIFHPEVVLQTPFAINSRMCKCPADLKKLREAHTSQTPSEGHEVLNEFYDTLYRIIDWAPEYSQSSAQSTRDAPMSVADT